METNIVHLADFLKEHDKFVGSQEVDAVVTDPPYFILNEEWDQQNWKNTDEFIQWLKEVVEICYEKLKDNRVMFMFCSQYFQAETDFMLRSTRFKIINRCVWHYDNNMGMYDSRGFKLCHEPFFYLLKGELRNFNRTERIDGNNKFFMDVKTYAMCKTTSSGYDKKQHPAQKPIKLMEELVQLGSYENEIILEPFSGSGTTLVAAKLHNRRYVGFERNPDYIPLINQRLVSEGIATTSASDPTSGKMKQGGLF